MENGINKITDKILADAEEEANRIIEDAKRECDDIRAAADKRANAIKDSAAKEIAKINEDSKMKIESACDIEERNAVLFAKAELVDRVYDMAKEKIISMNDGDYYNLLLKLLSDAVNQNESIPKYEEDSDDELFDYTVSLNAKDKEKYFDKLSSDIKGIKTDRKIMLSDEAADIDGGFILSFGDISTNCSISMIIENLRESTQGTVRDILFNK